jgi:hypothetical protein
MITTLYYFTGRRYAYNPRNVVTTPLLWLIVNVLWRGYAIILSVLYPWKQANTLTYQEESNG